MGKEWDTFLLYRCYPDKIKDGLWDSDRQVEVPRYFCSEFNVSCLLETLDFNALKT